MHVLLVKFLGVISTEQEPVPILAKGHFYLGSQRVWELNPCTSLERAYVSPRIRFSVATFRHARPAS